MSYWRDLSITSLGDHDRENLPTAHPARGERDGGFCPQMTCKVTIPIRPAGYRTDDFKSTRDDKLKKPRRKQCTPGFNKNDPKANPVGWAIRHTTGNRSRRWAAGWHWECCPSWRQPPQSGCPRHHPTRNTNKPGHTSPQWCHGKVDRMEYRG